VYHSGTGDGNQILTYEIFKRVITYFFFHRPSFGVGLFMGPNTESPARFR
jgi:hypothetical protein